MTLLENCKSISLKWVNPKKKNCLQHHITEDVSVFCATTHKQMLMWFTKLTQKKQKDYSIVLKFVRIQTYYRKNAITNELCNLHDNTTFATDCSWTLSHRGIIHKTTHSRRCLLIEMSFCIAIVQSLRRNTCQFYSSQNAFAIVVSPPLGMVLLP